MKSSLSGRDFVVLVAPLCVAPPFFCFASRKPADRCGRRDAGLPVLLRAEAFPFVDKPRNEGCTRRKCVTFDCAVSFRRCVSRSLRWVGRLLFSVSDLTLNRQQTAFFCGVKVPACLLLFSCWRLVQLLLFVLFSRLCSHVAKRGSLPADDGHLRI